MATHYCDADLGTGNNDGSDWDNAFKTFQAAVDHCGAGDVCYCKGTDTLGATVNIDTNAGTNAGGFIKYIGCNSSGDVDGEHRFVLDANGGSFSVVTFTSTAKMVWMENIEFKNTASGAYHGVTGASETIGNVFINCCANGCQNGFSLGNFSYNTMIQCVAYSNDSIGFSTVTGGSRCIMCASHDNADDGFTGPGIYIGCISHANTEEGYAGLTATTVIMNCVTDSNGGNGIEIANFTTLYGPLLLANRITNHSGAGDVGLTCAADGNDEPVIYGWNAFDTNKDHIANETISQPILVDSATLGKSGYGTTDSNDYNNEDSGGGGDTNQGYAAAVASNNFATNYVSATDPDLRRIAAVIPWT